MTLSLTIQRLVDAEELIREFMEEDFKCISATTFEIFCLSTDQVNKFHQIETDESDDFEQIRKLQYHALTYTYDNGNTLSDQIQLLDDMKIYNIMYEVAKTMGFELVLFGGWLVRVLSGLPMTGDIDVFYGNQGTMSLRNINKFKKKVELSLSEMGVYIVKWEPSAKAREDYLFNPQANANCYEINFSNGVWMDFVTRRPPSDIVDFNLNQLIFTPDKGIQRRVDHGNGMKWSSIFSGLYTRSVVTVDNYDKCEICLSDEFTPDSKKDALVRDHCVKMVDRYYKMTQKGLNVLNFKPNCKVGGECPIEQNVVNGLILTLRCGHSFGVDNLRKHVRENGPTRSKCPCCRADIVFDI